MHCKWIRLLQEEASSKSTLQNLNLDMCSTDQKHPIWCTLHGTLSIKQALVKALLLVQCYPLTTSQMAVTRCCNAYPLCKKESETIIHFILHCPRMSLIRIKYLKPIVMQNQQTVCGPRYCSQNYSVYHLLTFLRPRHKENCRKFLFKIHSDR